MIVASGVMLPVGPIIILIILIIGLLWAIKTGKLGEFLLVISGIGGCIALFLGLALLGDPWNTKAVAGSILILAGLHVFTSLGLALRKKLK